MNAINELMLYSVEFPSCLSAGLDVYYTVYNADGSVYLSRRNTGVIDFGNGKFGVELTFATGGGYYIIWDLNGTSYTAGEEINIYDYGSDDDIQEIKTIVQDILDMEMGRWKIDENTNQMIFYRADNVTEIARFSLHDIVGNDAYINIFERRRLP